MKRKAGGKQSEECFSFKWGDEKWCFFFFLCWALQGFSSLAETEAERLADKHTHTHIHRHACIVKIVPGATIFQVE